MCGRNWIELCGGGKRHSTQTSKPYSTFEIRRREHHGLRFVYCLRAWTDCHHRGKNEFQSVSGHFVGKVEATFLPTKMQQNNGWWIMTRMSALKESGPVRVLTSTRWSSWGMTLREWFTLNIQRMLLHWKHFVKMNSPKPLLTIAPVGSRRKEKMSAWGYCCQKSQPVVKPKSSHACSTFCSTFLHAG